jgi:hypothetical protein
MSNIKDNYRIIAQDIVEKGIQHVDFDPSKVVRVEANSYFAKYDNEAINYIRYTYEDEILAKMIKDFNYSVQWCGLELKCDDQQRWRKDAKSINFNKTVKSKLRKQRGKDSYTDKSIQEHGAKVEEFEERYNVDFVTNQYKQLVEHFNNYYREEQIKKVVNTYGDIYGWKWEKVEEVSLLDKEIKELESKAKELRKKKFEKQCDFAVEYINDKYEKIADVFKQPLVDSINEKREKGYVSPFFR